MTERMSREDERRLRQQESIGFVPAPPGVGLGESFDVTYMEWKRYDDRMYRDHDRGRVNRDAPCPVCGSRNCTQTERDCAAGLRRAARTVQADGLPHIRPTTIATGPNLRRQ